MHTENYIIESLELHLFFGRIMKEHSLFLKAGFSPANSNFAARAEFFKNEFEKLLSYAVSLSNDVISENVLDSGEIVTEFTIAAERQTEKFTGIHINSNITQRELRLRAWDSGDITYKFCRVKALNRAVQKQLNGLIALKEEVLSKVLNCQMFTMNYPLLIEHIIREAKLYRKYLHALESDGEINIQSMKDIECFWNQIMMEHA